MDGSLFDWQRRQQEKETLEGLDRDEGRLLAFIEEACI
jgi:hypothetical protein